MTLVYDSDLLDAQVELAWAQEARLLAELGVAGHVIDAGCGNGAFTARLAALAGVDDVTGVDLDESLLEAARTRGGASEYVVGGVDALPFADDTFDAAVIRLVLQHLEDPAAAIRELARVVKPGGLVAAIEVDGGMWGVCEPFDQALAAVQRKLWTSGAEVRGDRREPNRMIGRYLPRILADGGLDSIELRPYAYHSDDLGIDAFAPVLAPGALLTSVDAGTLSITEYATLASGFERFRRDPAAFVMLLGLLAAGRVPDFPEDR